MAQEMVHSLNMKTNEGNVVLKVDMAEAYDWVDWHFLICVMEALEFFQKVCRLISDCIEITRFSITMNETFKSFSIPLKVSDKAFLFHHTYLLCGRNSFSSV